jgi:hypothetical protein
MSINRRRAASTEISREKKLSGHKEEQNFASLIDGEVLHGTQKGDVKDKNGNLHSVKSGKKWQVFLYSYNRILSSAHLKLLQPCLDAFSDDAKKYFEDREKCIGFKENYIAQNGREKAKLLSNEWLADHLEPNLYIKSKAQLQKATLDVCDALKDKVILRSFLDEALFNKEQVSYLAIKDTTYKNDGVFKVFAKDDVLDILSSRLLADISEAGKVPEDYNVAGQKTLLRYAKSNGTLKNIVEIEIRNDSDTHYRQVRFNLYSKDALYLLLEGPQALPVKDLCSNVKVYGLAINSLSI